jgi:GntR family transcriptional regulator, arabinose operon transcriptional repressor
MANGMTQPNLSQQVLRHIYKLIQDGVLKAGDKLPTNRGLAEELGVSILTVQRSMKQLESQGAVTCHRRTGTFLVNPDAINSPKIQSGLIGLFVPEFFSDFHTDLLIELEQGMMEQGKLVSINFTHSDPEREITLLRSLARQRLEALVYFTSPLVVSSEAHCRTITSWINRYIEEGTQVLFADLCPPGLEDRLISLDNARAGRMLTAKLVERGHKNIAFLGPTHLPSTGNRLAGHYRALKEAGLPVNEDWHLDVRIIEGADWEERMEKGIRKMLSLYPALTGFAVSDQVAAEAVYKALSELPSRDFPAEESIAALFEAATPPFEALAWIQVPGKQMGQRACRVLLEDHPADYEPGHIKIRPTFWK